ncbi:telomerase-binding protein EST1A isoform X2 [Rhinatrema bivittatum]|nr:telomerase-binding protein EST1A isoform X2 [Rhinatrema bivittatum]
MKEPRQRRDNRRPDLEIYKPRLSRLRSKQKEVKQDTSGSDGNQSEESRDEEPAPPAEGHTRRNGTSNKDDPLCQEPAGCLKITRRVKKPDRQIYEPGKRLWGSVKEPAGPGTGEDLIQRAEQLRIVGDKERNRTGSRDPRGREGAPASEGGKSVKGEKGRRVERDRSRKASEDANQGRFLKDQRRLVSTKRYSHSDKRRTRARTCSSSSAGSNSSEGLVQAEGDRKGQERSCNKKQMCDSSTDSLDDDQRALTEASVPLRSPGKKRQQQQHHYSHKHRASKGDSIKENHGSPRFLSHSDCPQKGSPDHGNQVVETGRRGRGILILPANTDLCASTVGVPEAVHLGPKLTSKTAWGRGRGGTNRRLWDPNNPEQKPALRNPAQPLHFLDTDDETSPMAPGESSQPCPRLTPAPFYRFQSSDNPYYYHRSPGSNPVPQYPYGAYSMQYQMGPCYPGYPPPAGHYFPGKPLSPEEMEQQVRTLQQQELGRLLRVADNQELQLSNLLSRDRISPEGLEKMALLRAELLQLYERCILSDIEFSDSQNVDQILWKHAFYQVIEKFRQFLKDPAGESAEGIRRKLLELLEEGSTFFDALLQKLQVTYQFKLEDYMDGMAIRSKPLRKTVKYALISAQRCMICQGDIARYREQASDSTNYGKARSWYLKAQQIAPKNGRPYNQLALLAIYTRRKLDAVYYYMRSLAASNPILTAKESLISLFEETKRKAEQLEHKKQQEVELSPNTWGRGKRSTLWPSVEDTTRLEIWIHPSHPFSSQGSGSGQDSDQDNDLGSLSPSDLNKRFQLSFLHAHGKLFTRIGMETFPDVAEKALREFQALLQLRPSPIGSTRMLQLMAINMFTIHNSQLKECLSEDCRSVIQEQSTAFGLSMFSLLVKRCTDLLRDLEKAHREVGGEQEEAYVKVSSFLLDLKEFLPSVKVWSDWMLGYPDTWNPPPTSVLLPKEASVDVWVTLAEFCNVLTTVNQSEVPLYKDPDDDLTLLILEEDRLLSGFIPLLAAPQDPCYMEKTSDKAIAADCKRVTVLKYFLEALCGQEEPLLAFKAGKYVSVAPVPDTMGKEMGSQEGKQLEDQDDDVVMEAFHEDSEPEGSGAEYDIKELRAKKQVLSRKVAEQQRRQEKIQAVLEDQMRHIELEIAPLFLVPDTNGFIDYLPSLLRLLDSRHYILVVPLIVINELDGLAKGQESDCRAGGHARLVQEKAKSAVEFLEERFESRDPFLRALTSRGNELESIAFRSEDTTGQKGNNDDLILSCCLHYCKDKAKDFMPASKDEPIRLRREVVLLTDDRNLRVKALTHHVPVRDISAFLKWSKVG